MDGDAHRPSRLQPHLDGRPRERPGDGAGRHRDGFCRLGGPCDALPLLGGLSVDRARIVEVGEKEVTHREATAECVVTMTPDAVEHLVAGTRKGNPIEAARIAGVMGVKRTPDLLPFCHPIAITGAEIVVQPDPTTGTIRVETTVRADARTGGEIEAPSAAAAAC